ncbi:hypothetical protein PsorP6_014326 [Peronosclerospora sorghi]|uniref:Uncharacterized protein n=1 Tax=Peronosclerospora sorghi TaxID=230839 RepID=A0ACC0VHK5_9STRA|nr:hypothetical protein PsorP6_014326 [Peronosclerospora sorghi]
MNLDSNKSFDNHVFQNNSRNPQRPVNEQLMVTLKRFGRFGNGAFVGMLARFFVSPKEPLNCTQIGVYWPFYL